MKKIFALLSALVITLSLAACNGSPAVTIPSDMPSVSIQESAPESDTIEPDEPELSEYEQWKESILEHIDEAYAGKTDAGASMYFMWGEEEDFAALVLVNADGKSYISFAGDCTVDDDGILTVTDDETNYSFGFSVEKQAGDRFFLDCGNLGVAYLDADEPGDVLDIIMEAYGTMEDVTEKLVDALARADELESVFDVAYIGMTEAEVPMFFLASSDGEYAALVLVGTTGENYIRFVGSATLDEDTGLLTIIDSETDYTFSFTAESQGDGTFFLDCGNMGEAVLIAEEIEEVVDYIELIFLELNDVTHEVVTQLAG